MAARHARTGRGVRQTQSHRAPRGAAATPGLFVGSASCDITPPWSTPLAGFANRSGSWQSVESPLSVTAFTFGTRTGPAAILVCADLLWWGFALAGQLREEISRACRVPAHAVILHASHTHAAPHAATEFAPQLGAADPDYLHWLRPRVVDAARGACTQLVEVRGSRSVVQCAASVSRRGGARAVPMVADRTGPVDRNVTVLTFYDRAERIRAVLVHYACHPVVVQGLTVSADFPGRVRAALRAQLGTDVGIGYLQGCAGDVNPDIVDERGMFRPGTAQDLDRVATAVTSAVTQALNAPAEHLPPTPVRCERGSFPLPLADITDEQVEALSSRGGVWSDWACQASAQRSSPNRTWVELSALQLADGLTLLGVDAELTNDIGVRLAERHGPGVLPMTCSDGMIGYLVSADTLRRGGYEAEESFAYVYRPGACAPNTEEVLHAAVDTLLCQLHPTRVEATDHESA